MPACRKQLGKNISFMRYMDETGFYLYFLREKSAIPSPRTGWRNEVLPFLIDPINAAATASPSVLLYQSSLQEKVGKRTNRHNSYHKKHTDDAPLFIDPLFLFLRDSLFADLNVFVF